MEYFPYHRENVPLSPTSFSNTDIQERFLMHKFESTGNFVPERLEARGSGNFGTDVRRVIVLSKDKYHYQVFAIKDRARDGTEMLAAEDDDVSMSSGS
jgi:hypothetical protein